jgi:hypothetical protein
MERAKGTSKVAMMGSGRVQRLLCHACHMMVPLYARCQVMVPVRRKECAAAICKCLILHERIARLCFRLLPIYGLSHIRQGNTNAEVAIYRYVTQGSFDAYMWVRRESRLCDCLTGFSIKPAVPSAVAYRYMRHWQRWGVKLPRQCIRAHARANP